MATGTGLDGSIGVAPEGTSGTYAAPTRHFLWKSDSLARTKNVVQGSSFGSGQFDLAARRVVVTRMAKGNIALDLVDRGMGVLLDAAFGASTVVPRAGVTGVTDMTFTPAGLRGKTLSVQVGRPTSLGSVEPMTYVGGKVIDIDFTVAKSGIAELVVGLVAQDELTLGTVPAGPALVTPTPSLLGQLFSFAGASLQLNGVPAANVDKVNCKLGTPVDESRFFLNAGGTPAEMLQNAMRKVEGTIEAEFANRTLYDAFCADTPMAMVITLAGAPIGATGINSSVVITVPVVRLNGSTPPLSGPAVLKHSLPYVGQGDGVNPAIKIVYTTSDSAL